MSDRPVLRIVAGGEPSDEEVAALTTVLAALASRGSAGETPAARRWRDSGRVDRPEGRAGWLTSARLSSLRRPR